MVSDAVDYENDICFLDKFGRNQPNTRIIVTVATIAT